MSASAPSAPLVSVVIPVYDGERFIDACLASVFAQDHRPFEVIVVDDGSTDGTAQRLAHWPEVIVVHQANAGVSAARNAGIARSSGAFIALQDADDLWAPHKLTHQLRFMAEHPEHGYCAAFVQSFLEPGVPQPAWLTDAQLAAPRPGGIGNLLIRREVLDRVGNFAPDDPTDADWSLRAKEAGVTFGLIDEVLLRRRVHDRNMSQVLDGTKLKLAGLRAAIARKRPPRGETP